MHPSGLFEQIKRRNEIKSDAGVARLIGLTSGRVSQMRTSKRKLTARQLASYIQKSYKAGEKQAYQQPIKPIVEMYPIEAVKSRQDAKWEPLPTTKSHSRNQKIRNVLVNPYRTL